jgi:hypothetical protein
MAKYVRVVLAASFPLNRLPSPEDGGSVFRRNLGEVSIKIYGVIIQKLVLSSNTDVIYKDMQKRHVKV